MSATQRSGLWYGEKVSEPKHLSVRDIRKWEKRLKEEFNRFALHRERKTVVPIFFLGSAKKRGHYLPWFSMIEASLEKIALAKRAMES